MKSRILHNRWDQYCQYPPTIASISPTGITSLSNTLSTVASNIAPWTRTSLQARERQVETSLLLATPPFLRPVDKVGTAVYLTVSPSIGQRSPVYLLPTIAYKCIQVEKPMPVDLRKHNPEDRISIRPDTNKAKIIKLLYRNTNLGYTPAEIRKYLDLPRGSSSTTLTRLYDENG